MSNKRAVLFLCTGNSCRSQMAEGWARYYGSDVFFVQSAGLEAHGKNPRAIKVMQEAGVDISGQESTKLTPAMSLRNQLVITVCGHADEHCPVLPDSCEKRHVPFSDPAKAKGSEEEILQEFRRVREEIKNYVLALIAEFRDTESTRRAPDVVDLEIL